MLLDTLIDTQTYFKSTLVSVLQEAQAKHPDLVIAASYKTIMRREHNRVPEYLEVIRDPTNGWRLYTGFQIRKIIEYELKHAKKRAK